MSRSVSTRPFSALARQMKRFARDESGLIMTEFLIILPLLIWTFVAMVVFWDTYRTINEAQKASYAVSDAISRETDVTRAYLAGMEQVLELLLGRPNVVAMRVTSLQWFEEEDGYYVIFSEVPGRTRPPLTAEDLEQMRDRIPELDNGDSTLLVETWTNHAPAFDIGLPRVALENFITTRPRETHRICLVETLRTTCT